MGHLRHNHGPKEEGIPAASSATIPGTERGVTMDDQQILDTINGLYDVQERQKLRAQFQEEGRTEAFRDALAQALGRQAQKEHR